MDKQKDIIPKKYRSPSNRVKMDNLVRYLEDHEIEPEEALEYIITASKVDPTHPRTEWKILRFTYYLWERFKEFQKVGENPDRLGKKIDACFRVVRLESYKKFYEAYPFNPKKFDEDREAINLYKLVGDIRQRPFFKKRFYKFQKGFGPRDTNMPQKLIDIIR